MKKVTVLLVFALLLVASVGVSAQDYSAENMKFVGGMTYNTYDGSFDSGSYDVSDSGFGFYLGGQYWFDSERAVEVGYDRAMNEVASEDSSFSGLYGKFVYSISPMMNLKGGLAYYGFEADSAMVEDGNGMGILLGGEYEYPMDDGMSLVGSVNYRNAKMDLDNDVELDMSGFSVSGGVSIQY